MEVATLRHPLQLFIIRATLYTKLEKNTGSMGRTLAIPYVVR
jgi:hypothetical protein